MVAGRAGFSADSPRAGLPGSWALTRAPACSRLHAGRRGGADATEFVRASAESLPLGDREFDVALSCIAFHHFPDPSGALSEICRVLKPGGRLLVCDMCGEGLLARVMLFYGRLVAADRDYHTRESLAALARGAGFHVTGARIVNRFPPTLLLTASPGVSSGLSG